MNKTMPSMDCSDECFNCLKRGFCHMTIHFDDEPNRKPLHFCETSCMNVFVQDEITPIHLKKNQGALNDITELLEIIKKDPDLFVFKKIATIEKMLRNSFSLRKPKAELERLYALWQECATETLQQLGDDKDVQEEVVIRWAKHMKSNNNVFPSYIESLGR